MMTVYNLFIFNLGWQSKNSVLIFVISSMLDVLCLNSLSKNIFSVEYAKFIFFSRCLIIVSKILQPVVTSFSYLVPVCKLPMENEISYSSNTLSLSEQ